MNFISQSSLLAAAVITGSCAYAEPATDLAQAAHHGDLGTLRHLLQAAGPSRRAATIALDWAARGGHPAGPHQCRGESEVHLSVADALIDAGADVNAPDGRPSGLGRASGWTPLHTAVHHKQWAIARLLIEHGANPHQRSDQGVTPMEMASWAHADAELLKKGTE